MKTLTKEHFAMYLRNFVFGVEDSLVSTVGLLSGVAIAGVDRPTIFLTGIVLVFVEAFSMGVGSFLSEESGEEFLSGGETKSRLPIWASLIMFVSYLLSGFIPLAPYAFLPVIQAFTFSIILSLLALFALGMIGAKLSKLNIWRHGLKMMVIGGVAIALGAVAGKIFET